MMQSLVHMGPYIHHATPTQLYAFFVATQPFVVNLFGIEMFMGGQTTVGRAAAS